MSGTEERRVEEKQEEMDATAGEMAERGDQLDEKIEETKQGWEKAKSDDSVPTASSDWEDSEPGAADGEDTTGFDDPESADLDEDDDEDDERLPDE